MTEENITGNREAFGAGKPEEPRHEPGHAIDDLLYDAQVEQQACQRTEKDDGRQDLDRERDHAVLNATADHGCEEEIDTGLGEIRYEDKQFSREFKKGLDERHVENTQGQKHLYGDAFEHDHPRNGPPVGTEEPGNSDEHEHSQETPEKGAGREAAPIIAVKQ